MYRQILVAVDGSETSSLALDAALQLAREAGAQLQPLFVVDGVNAAAAEQSPTTEAVKDLS